jgi:DNA/RNA endonuclease YhcR with UshA esterase domain
MKKVLFLLVALVAGSTAWGQAAPFQRITQIQYVSPTLLASCQDSTPFNNQIVRTRGIVVTPGNASEVASGSVQGGSRPFFFIVDTATNGAAGPFKGMEIMGAYRNAQNQLVPLPNVELLIPGDLIEFTGKVTEFNHGTQMEPNSVNSLVILGSRPAPAPATVLLSQLNDAMRVNIPTTGEQWENAFVEFQNVTVTEVLPFSGNRVSFNVVDGQGNKINVSDRFLAQKLPSWQTVNPASPQTSGSFTPPVPGTFYSSLKGMVRHDGNGCFPNAGTTRGYELNPFAASHYQIAYAPPYISNFDRDPFLPTPNQSVDFTCNITDFDGTVDSVHFYYSSNSATLPSQFTKVTMPLVAGSTDDYAYTLPAFPNGTLVRYYIRAKDNAGNKSFYPVTSVGQAEPNYEYYTVRTGGPKIYDIQYSLASNSASPLVGREVTIKGIVTSSTKNYDLGYLYIQDENGGPYSGIWLVGSGIANFYRGEEVNVTGTVEEYFNMTRLVVSSMSKTGRWVAPTATVVDPTDSISKLNFGWEKWEGCLVRLQDPANGKLHISQTNLGFGDYAVSSIPGASRARSTMVLAGRQSGTAFSSLWVQPVTSLAYDTIDGFMEVDPLVVSDTMNMDALEGIVFFGFSNYRVLPRNNDDFIGFNVDLDSTNLATSPLIGIEEGTPSVQAFVRPNPARSSLWIDGLNTGTLQVEMTDVYGRIVLQTTLANGERRLDVGHLAAGTYWVRVTHNGRTSVAQSVLQK